MVAWCRAFQTTATRLLVAATRQPSVFFSRHATTKARKCTWSGTLVRNRRHDWMLQCALLCSLWPHQLVIIVGVVIMYASSTYFFIQITIMISWIMWVYDAWEWYDHMEKENQNQLGDIAICDEKQKWLAASAWYDALYLHWRTFMTINPWWSNTKDLM